MKSSVTSVAVIFLSASLLVLSALEDFVRRMRGTKDFTCKDLVEELTGRTTAELDTDFKSKIKQWDKNVCVGSTFKEQGTE